ncbi:class F sortase [Streptomyces sp. HNM0663]|uniref:Class F sortase n=1 Tax=Streptomyces chengmaiensis TaxID=3040919 RepID=A0ABT6HGV7_9ACTN|nr:class F sortase [Streptomyces chengmaiensis]MDH2387990.1 class F sortase [Streptomyces chengmaiensis]
MGDDYRDPETRRRSPWGVLALVMLTGIALMKNGVDVSLGPPQPAAAAALSTARAGETFMPVPLEPLEYAPVARVSIPSIKVDAPVVDVGLDDDGWVAAPPAEDPNLAGWYQNGIAPGQRGTAVVVGHVDNRSGPAVFYGLGSVKKGGHVEVARFDGKVVVFEVYGVEVFSKNDFPGPRVYADTGHAELRVITCGGGYSRAGGYDGNVVVFARMVKVR